MKLLVVEDDPTLADFIAKGLRQAGFVVDLCVDGKDALFRVATESYDLMIMDRMLPQVDGLTITLILYLRLYQKVRFDYSLKYYDSSSFLSGALLHLD